MVSLLDALRIISAPRLRQRRDLPNYIGGFLVCQSVFCS